MKKGPDSDTFAWMKPSDGIKDHDALKGRLTFLVRRGLIRRSMNAATMATLIAAHRNLSDEEFARAVVEALPLPDWVVLSEWRRMRRAWRPSAFAVWKLERDLRKGKYNND